MQLKTAFLSFVLLLCPCALCYGQLSFLGVNGERGYSAMRGRYVWDLDNNFILVPSYEFYRSSDDPDVEKTGTTHRYGLGVLYDFSDTWRGYVHVLYQPLAVNNAGISYYAGGIWQPFYRWGFLTDPFLEARLGRAHYRIEDDDIGGVMDGTYRQRETNVQLRAGAALGPWNLKTAWHKVIQYSNEPDPDIWFSWTDIPFMTAVVQGFLYEAMAAQVSFPTRFLTPYASAVRYRYAEVDSSETAVSAGVRFHWERTSFSGGVEVFEPRREESRRTFFSMSVEIDF